MEKLTRNEINVILKEMKELVGDLTSYFASIENLRLKRKGFKLLFIIDDIKKNLIT